MNFWNNPANNGIKVLIIAIALGGAGAFAYSVNKNDSLSNTGQVVSSSGSRSFPLTASGTGSPTGGSGTGTTAAGTSTGTTGTGSTGLTSAATTGTTTSPATTGTTGTNAGGTTKGGTTGREGEQCDTTTSISVMPSALPTTAGGGLLHFDTSVEDGGHFVLTNKTACQLKVTAMVLDLISTDFPSTVGGMPVWQPIGGITPNSIKLHVGNSVSSPTLFGAALLRPNTPVSGPRLMSFIDTTGVLIPPYGYQEFTLEVSSWNIPESGGQLAIRLHAFRVVKTLTGAFLVWTFPTSGIAASAVTGPTLTLMNP